MCQVRPLAHEHGMQAAIALLHDEAVREVTQLFALYVNVQLLRCFSEFVTARAFTDTHNVPRAQVLLLAYIHFLQI